MAVFFPDRNRLSTPRTTLTQQTQPQNMHIRFQHTVIAWREQLLVAHVAVDIALAQTVHIRERGVASLVDGYERGDVHDGHRLRMSEAQHLAIHQKATDDDVLQFFKWESVGKNKKVLRLKEDEKTHNRIRLPLLTNQRLNGLNVRRHGSERQIGGNLHYVVHIRRQQVLQLSESATATAFVRARGFANSVKWKM